MRWTVAQKRFAEVDAELERDGDGVGIALGGPRNGLRMTGSQ